MSFNFQSFLVKMRERSAFGLVSEIKTFIAEHSSKKMHPDEFVKIIRNFLEDTNSKLAQHELWIDSTDEELDNASEGLEKYLMNKMYKACFQPVASDDALRDQALADRLSLLSFIEAKHLDIPAVLCEDKAISMAMKELCKIDTYKAPRDKMVCVLNCCKIINNILQSHSDKSGADEFFPLLVYVTLQSRPPNLHSNIHFIQRFRSPDKLNGEAGYYFTNLQGAIEFVQSVDANKLSISQEEFDAELNKALESREGALGSAPEPEANLIDFGGASSPVPAPAPSAPADGGLSSLIDLPSVDSPGRPGGDNPVAAAAVSDPFGATVAGAEPVAVAAAAGSDTHAFDPSLLGEAQPNVGAADAPFYPSVLLAPSAAHPGLTPSPGVGMDEMMSALSEPPVGKFMQCSVEQLTMTDIPLLLADYKRLSKLTTNIQAFFVEQGIVDRLDV